MKMSIPLGPYNSVPSQDISYEEKQGSEKHQSQLCLTYLLLFLVTCFDFCGKPSSGNEKNRSRLFKYNY
jgi:hypothetical protein